MYKRQEYCNPGGPYFILELTHPVHYYQHQRTKIRRSRERRERDFGKNERYHARRRNYRKNKNENNPFKKRRVHQTKFKKKTINCSEKRIWTASFIYY